MLDTVVSFTGHRMQSLPFGEHSPEMDGIKFRLYQESRALMEQGCTEFLCGMAQGIDLIAAEQVIRLKRSLFPAVQLIAVQPYPDFTRQWSFTWKRRYEGVLLWCSQCKNIVPSYDPGANHRRDLYLASHCGRLIAVFNGDYATGTGYVILQRQAVGGGSDHHSRAPTPLTHCITILLLAGIYQPIFSIENTEKDQPALGLVFFSGLVAPRKRESSFLPSKTYLLEN